MLVRGVEALAGALTRVRRTVAAEAPVRGSPTMSSPSTAGPLHWTLVVPILALGVLVATWGFHEHWAVLVIAVVALVGAVFASVHHAEVVAQRVGEPFGSLVLAVAVTVIEVALIVTLMLSGGQRHQRCRATPCSPR